MKRLTKREVKNLLTVDTPPCVSVYLPLEHTESDREVAGSYKRLLANAEELLLKSYSPSVAERTLYPLQRFSLRDLANVRVGTLVLFASPTVEGYVLVPKSLAGIAVVSDSFHLKPLLEFLIPYEEFYLLSLGRDKAKLFRGDALSFEVQREFHLSEYSFETLIERPVSKGKIWGAFNRLLISVGFSGTSSERGRFFSSVDKHVISMLRGTRAPLLLAGARRDTRLYRSVNTYAPVVKPSLPNQVDEDDIVELESAYEAASTVAGRYYRRMQRKALGDLQIAGHQNRVKTDLEGVVNALARGRAQTLFFRKGEMSWGTVDWSSGLVRRSPFQRDGHDDDIIDDCIEKAIAQGCGIVALDRYQMPYLGPVTVILRAEPTAGPIGVAMPASC